MTTVAFLLSKDPVLQHGGDVALSRVAIELAAAAFDVRAISISGESGTAVADFIPGGLPLTRVRRTEIKPAQLLTDALQTRRSLVHVRFDSAELRAAIEASDADVFAAEHSYMAESFLHTAKFGSNRLVVSTHVSEALVWRATRGLLGRWEEPRLLRDELRVARAADAVATYDAEEAQYYREHGVSSARWLELTLPPTQQIDLSESPRRLVFMGARDWPPNHEAFLQALALWPRIATGIPGAELCVIGAKKAGAKDPHYPEGVRDLGFVDDLPAFLGTCRAMLAPIKTGGGVRVKLLDAASRGLPVVAPSVATGSLGELFELESFDDDDTFVAAARRLLLDRDAAVHAGAHLYQCNRRHWQLRRPHAAVEALLRADAAG